MRSDEGIKGKSVCRGAFVFPYTSDQRFAMKLKWGFTHRSLKYAAALTTLSVCMGFSAQVSSAEVNTTGLAVTDDTVTVGILHSLTGTMAISETGAQEAEKLAIKQINDMGGILGRKIEIIQEDGASDWPTFAEKSRKLLVKDKVAAVFGCWTSASRKAALPVFEKENGLL